MPAFAAGNGNFAHIAGELQIRSALGTAEILILLPVLEAVCSLGGIAAHIGGLLKVKLVFSRTLLYIAGEYAEKCPHIHCKAKIAENAEASYDSYDIYRKAGPHLYAGKLVSAISAHHEAAEAVFDFLPHIEQSLSFCTCIISSIYQLIMNLN